MKNTNLFFLFVTLATPIFIPASASADSADFQGGVAIGTGYTGNNTAPINGLIVQGNVGIGTSNPLALLSVGSSSQLTVDGSGNVTSSSLSVGSSSQLTVDSSGNVTSSSNATFPNLVGTSTNDNATAGKVGEYIESNCNVKSAATTITIASPAVVTLTNHGVTGSGGNNGGICPIQFSTTGSLPTGITTGTTYWTIGSTLTANTFEIATSIANAIAGTAVNTSGTQSGTQTATVGSNLANGITTNTAAISLTPGDWDVCGETYFEGTSSTSYSSIYAGITTTSAFFLPEPSHGGTAGFPLSYTGGLGSALPTGCVRQSLNTTTTEYLISNSGFSASKVEANSVIWARRRR